MECVTKGATTVHLMSAGDVMYEMSEQMIIIMMDLWRARSSRLVTDRLTLQMLFDKLESN